MLVNRALSLPRRAVEAGEQARLPRSDLHAVVGRLSALLTKERAAIDPGLGQRLVESISSVASSEGTEKFENSVVASSSSDWGR